jgi:hypothetical protein
VTPLSTTMALPDRSATPLGTSSQAGKPAFLVKFPQDVWERIVSSGSAPIHIAHDDSKLVRRPLSPLFHALQLIPQSLVLPDRTIGLDMNTLVPTEIYELSDTLHPLGIAHTRLSIPFTTASSSKAVASATPDKKPAINGAAAKIRQQAAAPLARSLSSPAGGQSAATAPAATAVTPVIPLKTRVVQYLALGPASVEEIVGRVGGAEADVMRVVKVVS